MKPQVRQVQGKAQGAQQEKSQDKYEQQKRLAGFFGCGGTSPIPLKHHHGWSLLPQFST
jgi:hypothetical protein